MSAMLSTFKRSCRKEVVEPLMGTTFGEVPPWLRGSLLRNGPGLMQIGPDRYNHAFDGMALLHRFNVSDGVVTYQNKFLRSETFLKNTRANRIIVSEFGTVGHPDPCAGIFERISSFFSPDSTDNALVNIMPIGDEYYAMTETPYLHRVDPTTLDTMERTDLRTLVAVNTTTAHPHLDPTDGATYNVGTSKDGYVIVKFPPGESAVQRPQVLATVPFERRLRPSYIHSFALTERYIVLLEQSLTVNVPKYFLTRFLRMDPGKCLAFDPKQPVRFHVIDKDTGETLRRKYVSDAFFTFHHINAYEESGHVIVDLCAYKDDAVIRQFYVSTPTDGDSAAACPRRYVLPIDDTQGDIGTNMVTLPESKARALLQGDGSLHLSYEDLQPLDEPLLCELPRVNQNLNGKPYRFFYIVAEDIAKGQSFIGKLDTKEKSFVKYGRSGWVPSEPVFVPRPGSTGEDDGVVLSALLSQEDECKVALVVLDAKKLEEQARTEFETPSAVTGTFHGWFVDTALADN